MGTLQLSLYHGASRPPQKIWPYRTKPDLAPRNIRCALHSPFVLKVQHRVRQTECKSVAVGARVCLFCLGSIPKRVSTLAPNSPHEGYNKGSLLQANPLD